MKLFSLVMAVATLMSVQAFACGTRAGGDLDEKARNERCDRLLPGTKAAAAAPVQTVHTQSADGTKSK